MLRGRHRGLPAAIDRALILPLEFEEVGRDPGAQPESHPAADDRRSSRCSATGLSSLPNGLGEAHRGQNESEDEENKRNSDEIKSNVEHLQSL